LKKYSLLGGLVFSLLIFSLLQNVSFAYAQSELELFPTDDAYVVTDLNDPQNIQGLDELNTGNAEFLKVWYAWDVTEHKNRIFSPAFLKFDLSEIQDSEIQSAILKLYVEDALLISDSRLIGAFLVDPSDWEEEQITYKSAPVFEDIFVPTNIVSTGWHEFDVTPLILQNTGNELSIAILFVNMESNTEEIIIISSKESQNSEQIPSLIITKQQKVSSKSDTLYPSDDAYVVTDLNDPQDVQLLQTLNTGKFDFLKIWYANDVTPNGAMISSNGYLKFDFSGIDKNQIAQATLNMKAGNVIKNADTLTVVLAKALPEPWDENTITYITKPDFSSFIIASSQISDPEKWYKWDITNLVKENNDPELTLVVGLDNVILNSEELVEFYSKENPEAPYLEIEYVSLENTEGGGCLVATATYGSEMAPQVQQLRELRDNQLLQTSSGTAFMTLFNQLYYSFSPTIADLERENPVFKETIRVLITPLISSLSILNYIDMDSESSVLGYGLSIIALNVGIYFVSPVVGLKIAKKLFSKRGGDQ